MTLESKNSIDLLNNGFNMVNLNENSFKHNDQQLNLNKENKKNSSLLYLNTYHFCGIFLILIFTIASTFIITKITLEKNFYFKLNKNNLLDLNLKNNKTKYLDIIEKSRKISKNIRLSTDLSPLHYNLKLQPFMQINEFYFLGNVTIKVNCLRSTNLIKMNSYKLLIDKSSLKVYSNSINYNISEILEYDEFLEIKLKNNLIENQNFLIYINFKGNLTDNLIGFYRSTYFDTNTNEKRYMVITQFESTNARRAFPCWDEPVFKAQFEITILHYKNMTAISNMPISSEIQIDNNWIKTLFYPTIKMSTYLVAFAVGDFKYLEDGSKKYKIWSRSSVVNTAIKALSFGPKILKYFENYFDIKYPLPKIDMLASPDFQSGAMENWGLIIYRETYLLYDKTVGPLSQLYKICLVIAHELAHQWFGNLVTPEWWDDLWLNEGFATFLSYEGVNFIYPEWNVTDKFISDEIQLVFNLDSLQTSHPISVNVNNPSEINEIFDHISYSKAAFIIRMVKYILGEDTFKIGLRNYLKKFAYKNTQQKDLWNVLSQTTKNKSYEQLNIKKIMYSWILKEGYPIVIVERGSGNESNVLKLKQYRFIKNKYLSNFNDSKFRWEIPITYTTSKELNWEPKIRFWLHETDSLDKSVEYTINQNLTNSDWIIVNLQIVGCYRVTYDINNWNLLLNQLLEDHEKIHRVNRAQLLGDVMNLADSKYLNIEFALNIFKYLKKENDYLPWTTVAATFQILCRKLRKKEIFENWQKFVRNIVSNVYNKHELKDISNETFHENELQKFASVLACLHLDKKCIKSAIQLFNDYINKIKLDIDDEISVKIENNIPPNVRQIVYCIGMEYGNETHWNILFKLYLKEESSIEKKIILNALTCTRFPWLLDKYLKMLFDEKSVLKQQDTIHIFKNIAFSIYGKEIAYEYLRENFEKIYSLQGESISFGYIIKSFEGLNSKHDLEQFKNLYKEKKDKFQSTRLAFLQTIEQIESNVKWMNTHYKSIEKFLN